MPTSVAANGQPFVIVPHLTRIAMAIADEGYIADQVCPRVPVAGELFQYTKVTTKDRFQHPDDTIARTGHLNELEFAQSDETDRTIDRGLAAPVPLVDVERAAQAITPTRAAWRWKTSPRSCCAIAKCGWRT
jgi:hypothetical protein